MATIAPLAAVPVIMITCMICTRHYMACAATALFGHPHIYMLNARSRSLQITSCILVPFWWRRGNVISAEEQCCRQQRSQTLTVPVAVAAPVAIAVVPVAVMVAVPPPAAPAQQMATCSSMTFCVTHRPVHVNFTLYYIVNNSCIIAQACPPAAMPAAPAQQVAPCSSMAFCVMHKPLHRKNCCTIAQACGAQGCASEKQMACTDTSWHGYSLVVQGPRGK